MNGPAPAPLPLAWCAAADRVLKAPPNAPPTATEMARGCRVTESLPGQECPQGIGASASREPWRANRTRTRPSLAGAAGFVLSGLDSGPAAAPACSPRRRGQERLSLSRGQASRPRPGDRGRGFKSRQGFSGTPVAQSGRAGEGAALTPPRLPCIPGEFHVGDRRGTARWRRPRPAASQAGGNVICAPVLTCIHVICVTIRSVTSRRMTDF